MRKIVMLSIFLLIALDITAHRYTDPILVEIDVTKEKAKEAHQIFLGAKQKILREDGKDYSDARKRWFECEDLYGNQSAECHEINQNLENALYQLSKRVGYKEYMDALEAKNYYSSKFESLRRMVDFINTASNSSEESVLFDAIDALPKPEHNIKSKLWIEWADNPDQIDEKVKNDLRDFAREIAKN